MFSRASRARSAGDSEFARRAPTTDERQGIRRKIEKLGPWFHYLELDGVPTKERSFFGEDLRYPEALWHRIEPYFPDDLTGKTVLDIGCNGGFFSLQAAARGGQVVGLDVNMGPDFVSQAAFAAEITGVDARFEVADFLSWTEGPYDLVLFLGVLYHLEHPFLGIQKAVELTRERLILETLSTHLDGSLIFCEGGYRGDETTSWDPGKECVDAMLRSSGLGVVESRHTGSRYELMAER